MTEKLYRQPEGKSKKSKNFKLKMMKTVNKETVITRLEPFKIDKNQGVKR